MTKKTKPKKKRKPIRGRHGTTGSKTQALTDKQRKFAFEYVRLGSAKEAAIAAGYAEKWASECGYAALQSVTVRQEVERLFTERLGSKEELKNKVLDELRKMAFSDIRQVTEVNKKGVKRIASKKWSDDTAAAVHEVSETITQSGGSTKVKMYDKTKALELLGKFLKLFTEKVEHSGSIQIDQTYEDLKKMSPEDRAARLKQLRSADKKLGGK